MGKLGVGIDKHNISLFLNISINCWKESFNFLLYKSNNLNMNFIIKIDKLLEIMTEIWHGFMSMEMFR